MSESVIHNFRSEKDYEYLKSLFKYGVPEETEIISEREEGNVYKLTHDYKTFVIKERKNSSFGDKICNVCVLREYIVGILINKYESPYLVRTLAYFEYEGSSFIVTKYVPGVSLISMISGEDFQTESVSVQIFEIVLHMVYTLGLTMEFTHYDLHAANIIIETVKKPHTYHLTNADGDPVKIMSKYKITFIDLSRSHVKDVPEMYCETATLDTATAPGIFDPMFDMAWIIGLMLVLISDDREMKKFMIRNYFNIDPNCHDRIGYPITADFYQMGDLFQRDKMWAATAASSDNITVSEVNYNYAKFLTKIGEEMDLEPDDAEEFDLSYPVEDRANRLPKTYLEYRANIIVKEKYIKLLGQAIVYDKIADMKLRPNTAPDMLREAISYVNIIRNNMKL
jgi:serine/threonine protein kinase